MIDNFDSRDPEALTLLDYIGIGVVALVLMGLMAFTLLPSFN